MNFQLLRRLPLMAFFLSVTVLSATSVLAAPIRILPRPAPVPRVAATLNVPSAAYPTIQSGIDAAQSGDTVLVGDGTYTGPGNVDLDFLGKDLTLKSQHGAASTVIDCQGTASNPHRGIAFHRGETAAAKLDGFTIENGFSVVRIDNPKILNDGGRGGGIYLAYASPTIINCILSNNTVAGSDVSYGGGIYMEGGSPTITASTFSGNTAGISGFAGVSIPGWGGGIAVNSTAPTITACTFKGNKAGYGGGTVFMTYYNDAGSHVNNCTFSGNTALRGGGTFTYYASPTFSNCTCSGNTAGQEGDEIAGTPILTNCIVYGDPAREFGPNEGVPTVTYSDIHGGYPGTGNIDADPLFVNAAAGDLHLQPGSPCLGKGTPVGAPATDLDGRTRPNPPSIGAYELGSVLNVPTQFPTIQAGIDAALPGDTVLVADGTYTGNGNRDLDFGGKNITVKSVNGAAKTIIDCGGGSSSDGSGNHRGFYIHSGENQAVISGLTVRGGYEYQLYGVDYSYCGGGICVVNSSATVRNCIISGNTSSLGGGVFAFNYNSPSSTFSGTIALVNCAISGNMASSYGGGVYNYNNTYENTSASNGSMMLTKCTISGNDGGNGGGGVFNANSDDNDNATSSDRITLTNCTISGNTARGGGGVVNYNYTTNFNFTYDSTIKLTNCTISGNTAGEEGGGVVNTNGGNNPATSSDTIMLTNCTISGNTAVNGDGGGVFNNFPNSANGTITLTNCIVYNDSNGISGSEVSGDGPLVSFNYCDVQGGYSGTGNMDKDPLFVRNPNLTAGPADYGDLHLQPGSPCLNSGTPVGAPSTDLDGTPRPNPPSMGAYELGTTVENSSILHLTSTDGGTPQDVDGIVCDNLSGMSDDLKDKLALTLPSFYDASNLTGTVTATGTNTHNTGEVRAIGGTTYYVPPDEYNDNQVPQDVTNDITKSATRTVTLTLKFTSGGTQHVVTKSITMARPPVVLVHGINSGPSRWLELMQAVQLFNGIRMPFALVNHSSGDGGFGGNGPVERAAAILKATIHDTLQDVQQGKPLPNGAYDLATESSVPFTDYSALHLAIRRVDVVGWSYGGVVTRWYINSGSPNTEQSATWYKRSYDTILTAAPAYGQDIRKFITLGSMWRGVPLINYLNEALFPSTNGIRLGQAPVSGLPSDPFDLIGLIGNLPIPTAAPAMEVMAINGPWMSQLIYHSPTPSAGTAAPTPFDLNIAYGSVAGDNNAYEATYGLDPYGLISDNQQPSWFPYLGLERRPLSAHAYSDGLVPLWSAAIPGGYPNSLVVPSTHSDYPDDEATQNYVMLWLNNSGLPQGGGLNHQWQDTQHNFVQTADGYRGWTFSPSAMAPHAENDLYQQVGGVGRINPAALKEASTARVSSLTFNSATVTWQTATDMDTQGYLYPSSGTTGQGNGTVKLHQWTFQGLHPDTTYYYEVTSTLTNPPGDTGHSGDITVGTNLYGLPHQLSFHTPPAAQPTISVSVLGPNSPTQRSFTLAVSNTGGDANGFQVVSAFFSPVGYSPVQPLPSAPIIQGGQTQTLRVNYTAGPTTAHLLCSVTYRYTDGNGKTTTATTPWLRVY